MIEILIILTFTVIFFTSTVHFYKKSAKIQEDKNFYELQYLRLCNFGIDDIEKLAKSIPSYKKYLLEIRCGNKELQELCRKSCASANITATGNKTRILNEHLGIASNL